MNKKRKTEENSGEDSTLIITVNDYSDNSDMALQQFFDWKRVNDLKCNAP